MSAAAQQQIDTLRFDVLGVRFAPLQICSTMDAMMEAVRTGKQCVVTASNVHSVVEAQHRPEFKKVLNSTLCVPDGMPIVWLARRKGYALERRVYGPELMVEFCSATEKRGVRHYFYGGAPEVLARMLDTLTKRFPDLQVAGSYSPPFRRLKQQEHESAIANINASNADVLWVGLGCPKQEFWMANNAAQLKVPVMVGVGQAFNILAGELRQAPSWMRERGLEWLFRLLQEPRRLWKRYLVYNTQFIAYNILEASGLRRFD